MPDSEFEHKSILVSEILGFLDLQPGSVVIDATLGLGGHAAAVLQTFADTKVIGIDQDQKALENATERLKSFGSRFQGVHSNFVEIASVTNELNITAMDAVIADLGVSSMQLDA